eukprot:3326664-Prymnesium_polylepis.1
MQDAACRAGRRAARQHATIFPPIFPILTDADAKGIRSQSSNTIPILSASGRRDFVRPEPIPGAQCTMMRADPAGAMSRVLVDRQSKLTKKRKCHQYGTQYM